MKIYLKGVFFGLLLLFTCIISNGCNNKKNIGDDFFIFENLLDIEKHGYHSIIAKVSSDKIQFFIKPAIKDAKWTPIPEVDFKLPKNIDYIFCINNYPESGICVVIKDIVHTYQFINNQWEEMQEYSFTLPIKYDHLFFNGYFMGIITDKKIRFFDFDEDGKITEDVKMSFDLPDRYKNVFSTGMFRLNIVLKDSIQFYDYDEKKKEWTENHDWSFTLPTESKNVISAGQSNYRFGIIFDNYIQFYDRYANKWMALNGNPTLVGEVIYSGWPIFEFNSEDTSKTVVRNTNNDEQIFNGVWASLPYETWRSSAITGGTVAIFVFDTKTNSCQIGAKKYLPFSGINIGNL